MKILIATQSFYPEIGGVITVTSLLAEEFTRLGHEVQVITFQPEIEEDRYSYKVIREPSLITIVKSYQWCNVIILQGNSIKFGWPIFFLNKLALIVHHIWQLPSSSESLFKRWFRQRLLDQTLHLCVSEPVGKRLGRSFIRINNPYSDRVYKLYPEETRDRDLVYLGRLQDCKGVDLLISALSHLKKRGLSPTLSIIGEGDQIDNLKQQVYTLGLERQVTFTGSLTGIALAKFLNQHRIMVIPSRWDEPFGIVALEGIACGCVIVGSQGGGLPDAIGLCGQTFRNGDVEELTSILESLLRNPQHLEKFRSHKNQHLEEFKSSAVAEQYLSVINKFFIAK